MADENDPNMKGYKPLEFYREQEKYDRSSRIIRERPEGEQRYKGSLSPSKMEFGVLEIDEVSNVQKATLTNVGYDVLTLRSMKVVGDYLINTNCPEELEPGQSCEIQITFNPHRNGVVTGGLYIDTGDAAGTEFIELRGSGTGEVVTPDPDPDPEPGVLAVITLKDAVLRIGDALGFNLPASTLDMGKMSSAGFAAKVFSVSGATTKAVTMTTLPGDGGGFTFDYASTEDGPFASASTFTIPIGGKMWVMVGYEGNEKIANSRVVTFASAALSQSNSMNVSVAAYVAPVEPDPDPEPEPETDLITARVRIAGNQFYVAQSPTDLGGTLPSGGGLTLKSVNWFGAEGNNLLPHGTWLKSWKSILDQIKTVGFNCIRLPFSGSIANTTAIPPSTAIDATINPDLVGKTAIQIMDMIITYCRKIGLYVVLDHHRRQAGDGADGSPIGTGYTKANWLASWAFMANRYKGFVNVVGADVHNEPHDHVWSAWALLVEECGNAIHQIAPDWVIFCEGVGHAEDLTLPDNSYWWGGYLVDVATRPIVLTLANRVAYSPHEYGQSVGSQTWQARDGSPVVNYPANLPAVWDKFWGFIHYNKIAPIWIGEMGGHFGLNANTGVVDKPHAVPETQWMQTLVKYLNGDKNADGTTSTVERPAGTKGMSWAWWGWQPMSGDTGGLVRADFTTLQAPKIALIQPLLAQ